MLGLRLVSVAVVTIAVLATGSVAQNTHFALDIEVTGDRQAKIFFPAFDGQNQIDATLFTVQRSPTNDFSTTTDLTSVPSLLTELQLYEVSDPYTDWPGTGEKPVPWYRVKKCPDVACATAEYSQPAQAGVPHKLQHQAVFTEEGGTTDKVAVLFQSPGAFWFVVEKAADDTFATPTLVTTVTPASQGWNYHIDSAPGWTDSPHYYRVRWCLVPSEPDCSTAYTTPGAQPSQLAPPTGAFAELAPNNTVVLNFPQMPLGTLIFQRAASEAFTASEPTTVVLGSPTLPATLGQESLLDNTNFWNWVNPLDPIPWYRIHWCLDPTYTWSPAAPLGDCSLYLTSPAVRPGTKVLQDKDIPPQPWSKAVFGYYLPDPVPVPLTASLSSRAGEVQIGFLPLAGPFRYSVWREDSAGAWVEVGPPGTPPFPESSNGWVQDAVTSWVDPLNPPSYQVRACLDVTNGCELVELRSGPVAPALEYKEGPTPLQHWFVHSPAVPPSPPFSCSGTLVDPCPLIQYPLAAAPEGSEIHVLAGVYIGFAFGALDFGPKSLTLKGVSGEWLTLLSGAAFAPLNIPASRIFAPFTLQDPPTQPVVQGFAIVGGESEKGGCALVDGGSPVFKSSTFASCTALGGADSQGGAVHVEGGGNPTFQEVTFAASTSVQGGCLSVQSSSASVLGSNFLGCSASNSTGYGGGIFTYKSSVTITASFFTGNIAGYGGGLATEDESFRTAATAKNVTVIGSTFVANYGLAADGVGGGISFSNTNVKVLPLPPVSESEPATRTTVMQGGAIFAGGGVALRFCPTALFRGTDVIENQSTHGGGVVITTSNMTMEDVMIHKNAIAGAGGGFLVYENAVVVAVNTTLTENTAMSESGGGISISSGKVSLLNCTLAANRAKKGGGIVLTGPAAEVEAQDSLMVGNLAADKGGALLMDTFKSVKYTNVVLRENAATIGGAVYCQDVSWTAGKTPMQFVGSTFLRNRALDGGALFMENKCSVLVNGSTFENNTAVDFGGAVAMSPSATMTVTSASSFVHNGHPLFPGDRPAKGGGAISQGLFTFSPDPTAHQGTTPSRLTVEGGTVFEGNVAMDRGGAIISEEGELAMQNVTFRSNMVSADTGLDGIGAALSLRERCPTPTTCETVTATLIDVLFEENVARAAGGAIAFEGNSELGTLVVEGSRFLRNHADSSTVRDGVGGALFISRPNFNLSGTIFEENSAYYGGALFVSTDVSGSKATTANLTLTNNQAVKGAAVYWLRFLSPGGELPIDGLAIDPPSPSAVTTEIMSAEYSKEPAISVFSKQDMAHFTVELLDYYSHVAVAESSASCHVAATPSALTKAVPPSLRGMGSSEAVVGGVANFSRVQLTGLIGEEYELEVKCSLMTLGRSELLQFGSTPPLAPLALPLIVSSCPPGSQPNRNGDGCIECFYGQFNFDGRQCLACPEGGVCPGGADILSEENWWRASTTSANFYACKTAGVCLPGPAAGNDSCLPGQHGPLCAVCNEGHYKFSGGCTPCGANGQSQAMLATGVILASVVVLGMFSRDWDFGTGPGILTKLKILLAHFQIMALFRDYDLKWPQSTNTAFSWFEFFNVGLSITAPECFVKGAYNFYWFYVFSMSLPFILVGMCLAAFVVSHLLLKRLDPTKKRRLVRKGLVGWLGGLQIRCWKNSFWFVTLLYPRSAMTALQLFGLQKLDDGWYLTADYSIMTKALGGAVSTTYIKYMVPGIALLIVFAIVIPAFWFLILWYNRKRLDDPMVAAKYGFLYSSYDRRLPYWETTEMIRKFIFTLLPVFISPQSTGSLQAAVGQIVLVFYLLLTTLLKPFARRVDNMLQIGSLCVLFLMLLSGAAAKWADLSDAGDRGLAAGQLALTTVVGFVLGGAVLLNGIALLRSWLRRRKLRSSKVASLTDASEGLEVPPPSKGGNPSLATIRIKAGTGATDDNEAPGTLGVGYSHLHSAGASPERHGDETPRGDDTPRHGDESPLLKKHSQRGVGGKRRSRRGTGGVGRGEEQEAQEPLSPRALPPSSTFVANPRVERWIDGSESSFDKKSLIRHISEKERRGGGSSSGQTPREVSSGRGDEPLLPKGDPLNLNIRD